MAKATTVRFTDELYQRLDVASARTGLPVNSIVVAACLEWMQRHTPEATAQPTLEGWPGPPAPVAMAAPRWSTVRRAIELAMTRKDARCLRDAAGIFASLRKAKRPRAAARCSEFKQQMAPPFVRLSVRCSTAVCRTKAVHKSVIFRFWRRRGAGA